MYNTIQYKSQFVTRHTSQGESEARVGPNVYPNYKYRLVLLGKLISDKQN